MVYSLQSNALFNKTRLCSNFPSQPSQPTSKFVCELRAMVNITTYCIIHEENNFHDAVDNLTTGVVSPLFGQKLLFITKFALFFRRLRYYTVNGAQISKVFCVRWAEEMNIIAVDRYFLPTTICRRLLFVTFCIFTYQMVYCR